MSDRVLRLGIVGLGRGFSLMLPTFLKDARVRLSGAAEPRLSARQKFQSDFGANAYETIEELLDHGEDLDAIYVASPHQLHCQHVSSAASIGKPVLVEKPLALDIQECDRMIEACRAADVPLIVGHCHSFNEPYRATRDLIKSGEYGAVRSILAINYTDYLYRPRRPEELDTDQGGGAFYSQGAHQVDIIRLLAGEEPAWVHCAGGAWDPARPTEGAYSALLGFPSGAYASMIYSGYAHFDSDEWMDWIGEMGQTRSGEAGYGKARRLLKELGSQTMEAELKHANTFGGSLYKSPDISKNPEAYQHFGPIIVSCDRADLRPLPNRIEIYADDRQIRKLLSVPRVPRSEVIDELWDAVFKIQSPRHSGEWGRQTVKILDAMLRSAKLRHPINIR